MKECVLSWTNVAQCQVIMIIIDTAVTPPGARERRLGRTFDSVWSVAWRGLYRGRHSLNRGRHADNKLRRPAASADT